MNLYSQCIISVYVFFFLNLTGHLLGGFKLTVHSILDNEYDMMEHQHSHDDTGSTAFLYQIPNLVYLYRLNFLPCTTIHINIDF